MAVQDNSIKADAETIDLNKSLSFGGGGVIRELVMAE